MKTFDLLNRRTHLYLGLLLLPWMFMYGISSLMISHPDWFRTERSQTWDLVSERDYSRPVKDGVDLRELAGAILEDIGMEGAFWAQKPNPNEIRINRFRFRDETRITYLVKEEKLRIEHQGIPWKQVIMRLHFRGGFMQPSFWSDAWALLVDFVCLTMLVWVISGLIMWWKFARLRLWGGIALAGGVLSFLILVWRL